MKHLIKIIPLFFAVTGLAFASPRGFIETLNPLPEQLTRESEEKCENFTGNWDGVCVGMQGKKIQEAFSVKQYGCEALSFRKGDGGFGFAIGGLSSYSLSIPNCKSCGNQNGAFGSGVDVSWNKEKTVVSFQIGGMFKTGANPSKGFFLYEEARIVNGKLVVDIYEMSATKKQILFCEFDKKA